MATGDAPKRVALALGAGGARGYAHIGVIEEIEARGWEIAGIAGSSMGSVVGGLYAAGALAGYRDWVTGLGRRDVLRLMDPTVRGAGILRASKVMNAVREYTGDVRIEDLSLPYTAIAVDLVTQREVWFSSGPLVEAMRASIAIPSVFTPLQRDGMVLADGGMLNPVPVAPLADLHVDAIVAVNLSGATADDPNAGPEPASSPLLGRLKLPPLPSVMEPAVRALMRGQRRSERGAQAVNFNTIEVVDRSLHLMQSAIRRYRLAAFPPDVLIDIPHDSCGTLDFHRAQEMIDVGRERAATALDEWPGEARLRI